MKIVLFFILSFVCVGNSQGQNNHVITIHGKITDSSKGRVFSDAMLFEEIILINAINKKIIDSTLSDASGKFEFANNLISGKVCLKVLKNEYEYSDTTFPAFFLSKDTSIVLNNHQYCIYDKSLTDSICPKCHKRDMVIPIIYGLIITRQTRNNRNIKQEEEFHPGGCSVWRCQPYLYCKRDSLEF